MSLHAIILTLNEEKHLERCLASIAPACESILVVDSGSADRTVEIARRFGADVLVNRFKNYATQLNFGIAARKGRGGWLLRIDADEVLLAPPEALAEALAQSPAGVNGLLVRRRMHFLGRPMRWGGMDPVWQLRLWREGEGACEQRWMDEHVIVQGATAKSRLRIDDINLNHLGWWTEKHNGYAAREAVDVLARRHGVIALEDVSSSGGAGQAGFKRALKNHLYLRLGGGLRATLYFLYRYVLRLGFLDGREGFYFHLLQGLWYRTLVDAKVFEIERHAAAHGCGLVQAIRACTGIDLEPEPPAPSTVRVPVAGARAEGVVSHG